MSNILKNVLIFAGGFICGSIITAKVVGKEVEERIREEYEVDEEVEEVEEWDKEPELRVVRPEIANEDNYICIDNVNKKGKFTLYNHITKPNIESLTAADLTPRVILSSEECDQIHTMTASNVVTLYYYNKDDTLSDENEEVIIDPILLIGEEALTSFGKDPIDPDVIYVWSPKEKIYYEVVRVDKSYAETILGIPIEKPTEHNRKKVKLDEKEPE